VARDGCCWNINISGDICKARIFLDTAEREANGGLQVSREPRIGHPTRERFLKDIPIITTRDNQFSRAEFILLYGIFAFADGFRAVNLWAWFWIVILFIASGIIGKNKWYGCIGGLMIGCVLIYYEYTTHRQVIDMEEPWGIILCTYYLLCGAAV
jgi:hypothetical protein